MVFITFHILTLRSRGSDILSSTTFTRKRTSTIRLLIETILSDDSRKESLITCQCCVFGKPPITGNFRLLSDGISFIISSRNVESVNYPDTMFFFLNPLYSWNYSECRKVFLLKLT